jgi:hypothetical protein
MADENTNKNQFENQSEWVWGQGMEGNQAEGGKE